jgi:hypothetical protein
MCTNFLFGKSKKEKTWGDNNTIYINEIVYGFVEWINQNKILL